jgi:glutathione peroxidase
VSTLHDFKAESLAGKPVELDSFKDKLALVVNTASECGFTPQYAGLEALQKKYSGKGFAVLGFPCDQFGGQEPGSAREIESFCRTSYGVSFPMFAKIDVNGPAAHPLYRWLKEAGGGGDIEWNFVKFLVGPDGEVIRRYEPKARPEDIAADIESLLNEE